MSFDAIEKSAAESRPYELYLFQGTGIDLAFANADREVSYLGHTFLPATISRDAVDQSAEVDSGKMTVHIPENHPIAQLFVAYLPTSPVAVTVFGAHYGDAETGVVFAGTVASAHFTDEGECEIICQPDQYKLQQKIPRVLYQSGCVHIFGDKHCGFNLATVTYAGSVTAISDDGLTVTVPAFDGLPHPLKAGYFRNGNNVRMIVGEGGAGAGKFVKLFAAIPGNKVGDIVLGTAGCGQDFDSCVGYNNVANLFAFDLIPKTNPFDGSIQ